MRRARGQLQRPCAIPPPPGHPQGVLTCADHVFNMSARCAIHLPPAVIVEACRHERSTWSVVVSDSARCAIHLPPAVIVEACRHERSTWSVVVSYSARYGKRRHYQGTSRACSLASRTRDHTSRLGTRPRDQ